MFEPISKILDVFGNTLVLLILTFSIMAAVWFITLPLCGLCFYCWYFKKSSFNRVQSQSFAAQRILKLSYFAPYAITLAIAALGGNFWKHPSTRTDYFWVMDVIGLLLIAHLSISVITIWNARQKRPFVASLSILQLWVSLCAAFISGMTTSGNWL